MYEKLMYLAGLWVEYKQWLVDNIGLTDDSLHIHFAIGIIFVVALVLRCRPDNFKPWLVLFLFEVFNEFSDMWVSAPDEGTWKSSLHDFFNTMFWPTVLLIAGRLLFPPREKPKPADPPVGDG